MCNKEDALRQIDFVKSHYSSNDTLSYLNGVVNYINEQQEYSYNKLHHYIDSITPTKMGGIYIEIGKSLRHLKQRLKITKK